MKQLFTCILLSLLFCSFIFPSKIEKAYNALEIYNYFEAKRLFQQTFKKEVLASGYGLATIYSRNDNPFYNLDSAFRYAKKLNAFYAASDTKRRIELKKFSIDSLSIIWLQQKIDSLEFVNTKKQHTLAAYQKFIEQHKTALQLNDAVEQRNQLAYELAKTEGTLQAYQQFIDTYPNSKQAIAAKKDFDRKLYLTETKENKI